MQRRANRYADCIVANSRAAAEYAIRREGAPENLFRVIPNGVDPKAYQATCFSRGSTETVSACLPATLSWEWWPTSVR